jgi:hypothetical protein
MQKHLETLDKESIVKVVVQNDVFDIFTNAKVCYRCDLATGGLLREIDFDIDGLGDVIIDVKYFERKDIYVISSSENFAVGDFVYGFTIIPHKTHFVDIRADYLAFATEKSIEICSYPSLEEIHSLEIDDVLTFCFVNEDREMLIVCKERNYLLTCESMILDIVETLPYPYKELRYKSDYLIGIKEYGIDFIEEDLLEVSQDYPSMELTQKLSALRLCENENYIILGGDKGEVAIFNIQTDEVFYQGIIDDNERIETINMDMDYQSVLMYTKRDGVVIHPFVDFV